MITEKFILERTRYGRINCLLKDLLLDRKISIYQLSRMADIKYEIIERYCSNCVMRYDTSILSRLCYTLDCQVGDIIEYSEL